MWHVLTRDRSITDLLLHTHTRTRACQCQSMSIKNFSVAKIAELLRSPQRRSRVTIQNQEMTDGKQVEMEMIECQLAVSSKGVMQRLERSIDRRL